MGQTSSVNFMASYSLADLATATAVTGGFSSAGNVKNVGKAFQSALKSSEAGILALFGTRAATSALTDAAERGATDLQALIYGIMNGAAEVVFEKVSLDSLISMSNQKTIRSLVKNALNKYNRGVRGVFTTIAKYNERPHFMGDKSDIISSLTRARRSLDWFKGLAWDYITARFRRRLSGVTSTLSFSRNLG